MRKEVVYSFLALGAIPVTVSAADVTVAKDVISSPTGTAPDALVLGDLVPGNYQLKGNLASRVYDVKFTVKDASGKVITTVTGLKNADPQGTTVVTVDINLKAITKGVSLTLESENPGAIAAAFDFTPTSLQLLDFDGNLPSIKAALKQHAAEAQATIGTYTEYKYNNQADVEKFTEAEEGILAKIDALKATYADYRDYELYETAGKATYLDKKIAEALNDAAFAYVNNAISNGAKNFYNDYVKEFDAVLVDAAQYLHDAGIKKLQDINEEITKAYTDNSDALKAGTAADKVNAALANVEALKAKLDGCRDDYNTQAKANKDAFAALKKSYTDLQAALDKVKDYDKTAAQAAVDKLKEIVEKNYNKAGQLNLAKDASKDGYQERLAAAQKAVNDLAKKQTEKDADQATTTDLNKLTAALNTAKGNVATAIAASKQGYPSGDKDPNKSVADAIQKDINTQITAAANAYKNGTAEQFNKNLKATTDALKKRIEDYEKESKLAVTNYDKVWAAIKGYEKELDAANAWLVLQPIYNEKYNPDNKADYEYKLGLVGKDIFDLKDKVETNMKAGGEAHWTNMKVLVGQIEDNDKKILDKITEYTNALDAYDGDVTTMNAIISAIEAQYNDLGKAKDGVKKNIDAIKAELKTITDDYAKIKDPKAADAKKVIDEKIVPLYQNKLLVVEKQATAAVVATKAIADLKLATVLSGITYVKYDAAKEEYSYVEASAKVDLKVGGKDWFLYKTGLATGETCAEKLAEVNGLIKALNTAIGKAAEGNTLDSDWETLKNSPAEIQKKLDAIKAKAAAEEENYKYFKDAINDYNAPLTTAIANAKVEAQDADGEGKRAVKHYQDVVIKGYENDQKALVADMEASLNNRDAKTKIGNDPKKGYVKSLLDLTTLVKGVKDLVEENWDTYQDQLDGLNDVQQEWNKVYSDIATGDESKERDNYLKKLDKLQEQIDAHKAAIEDNYVNGKSVEGEIDFTTLLGDIKNLKAEQEAGYDKVVAENNKSDWENAYLGGIVAEAKQAYSNAVKTRNEYRSSNADAELEEKISKAAATLDEVLYRMTVKDGKNPTQPDLLQTLDDLIAIAQKDYLASVSPIRFKVEPHRQAIQDQVITPINDALKQFLNDVKAAISDYWTGKANGYNAQVAVAKNTIGQFEGILAIDNAKGARDAEIEKAVKSVQDIIKRGNDAADPKLADLAGVEQAVRDLRNIDIMLAQCVDVAAKADLDKAIAKRDGYRKNLEDLGNYVYETYGSWEDAFELYVTKNLEKAKELRAEAENVLVGEDGYKEILGWLQKCDSWYNNVYTNAKAKKDTDTANQVAYDKIIEAIKGIEASLAEAKAVVDQYKYVTIFENSEKFIDQQYKDAASSLKYGYAKDIYESLIETIKNQGISAINKDLLAAFDTEHAGLKVDIANLKSEYSEYIDPTKEYDKTVAAAFQKAIEDLTAEHEDIGKKKPASSAKFADIITASKNLIKFQEKVAKQQTDMSEANSGDGAKNKAYAELNDAIQDLVEYASLANYDPWVGEQTYEGEATLNDKIAEVLTELAALKERVDAETELVYYQGKYMAEIGVINEALDEVHAEAKTLQKQVDASDAAYAKYMKVFNEVNAKIEAAKAEIAGYEYYENYQYSDYANFVYGSLWRLYNVYVNDLDVYDETKSVHLATRLNQYFSESAIAGYEGDIRTCQNWCAYQELRLQYINLESLFNAAPSNNNDKVWSEEIWAKFYAIRTQIYSDLISLGNDITNSYQWSYSYEDYEWLMTRVADIKTRITDYADGLESNKLGDVTGDGKISAADYTYVIDIVTGHEPMPEPGTDRFKAADINGDGVIDAIDATQLVNIILTGSPVRTNGARSTEALTIDQTVSTMQLDNSGEEVTFNVLNVQGNTMRMALAISNVNAYSNMQADIVLPAGMTIVGKSVATRAEGHDIAMGTVDGVNRLLVISAKNAALTGNAGAVAYIDVEVSNDYNGGEIVVENIIAVTAEANYAKFNAVNGNVTGIDGITTDDSLKGKIYNLGGKLMDGLKKGINIINGKKVVVK